MSFSPLGVCGVVVMHVCCGEQTVTRAIKHTHGGGLKLGRAGVGVALMSGDHTRMKYSPTYKVAWMVGPRKGQNFFSRLPLRDLALWSWASRSCGEVVS